MIIKTLNDYPIKNLTEVFNLAFSDYAIQITHTPESKKHRLLRARVELDQSIGAFDDDGQLIAFMLSGIGQWHGQPNVYNAGTGVIPSHRGQRLVKKMYDYAIPLWKKEGYGQVSLEVLVGNDFAIKAYESVGMTIQNRLISYHGQLPQEPLSSEFHFTQKDTINWKKYAPYHAFYYSWDFCQDGVNAVADIYNAYELSDSNQHILGYAIVNKQGQIAQAGVKESTHWLVLLNALGKHYKQLKWINIDEHQTILIETLKSIGWEKLVEQFEMKMLI